MSSGGSTGGEDDESMGELLQENDDLKKELEEAEDEVENLRERVTTLEDDREQERKEKTRAQTQLEEKTKELEDMERDLERLRKDYNKISEQLNKAKTQLDQTGRTSTSAVGELHQRSVENEQLREDLREREEEVAIYRKAAEEAEEEITEVANDRDQWQQKYNDLKEEYDQFCEEKEQEYENLRQAREDDLARFEQKEKERKKEIQNLQDAKEKLKEEVQHFEKKADEFEKQLKVAKGQSNMDSMEQEINRLRHDLEETEREREGLKQEAVTASKQLNKLWMQLEQLEEARETAFDNGRQHERRNMQKEMSRMEELKKELEKERQNYRQLEDQLEETQVALQSAKHRNHVYEKQYGTSELTKELDSLKVENSRLQEDLNDMADELRQYHDTVHTLTEIARRLAQETGKYDENVDIFKIYDTNDLMAKHTSLVEQYKMDNELLEKQVADLQQQNTDLYRQLRVHARQTGEGGPRYYGLTGDQVWLVDEFAEKLRQGKEGELPERDESYRLRKEVEQLREKLRQRESTSSTTTTSEPRFSRDNKILEELTKMQKENKQLRKLFENATQEQLKRLEDLSVNRPGSSTEDENDEEQPRSANREPESSQQYQTTVSSSTASTTQVVSSTSTTSPSFRLPTFGYQAELTVGDCKSKLLKFINKLRREQEKSGMNKRVHISELLPLMEKIRDTLGRAVDKSEVPEPTTVVATMPTSHETQPVATTSALRIHTPQRAQPKQLYEEARTPVDSPGFMSPGTRSLLKKTQESSLPPSEWADEVESLTAALLQSLEQLALRQDETEDFNNIVDQYKSSAQKIATQMSMLYQSYIQKEKEWNDQLKSTKEKELKAKEELEAVKSQSAFLKEISRIDGEPEDGAHVKGSSKLDSLREMNRKLTRRLAHYEANTPSLKRKVALLEDETKQANESRRIAEASVIEVNTSLQQRILYLELWKRGAEARLSRMSELLSRWVPEEDYMHMAESLRKLHDDHNKLLEDEADVRVQLTQARTDNMKLQEIQTQNVDLSTELEKQRALVKNRSAEVEDLREKLQNIHPHSVPAEGDAERSNTSSHDPGKLLAEIARLKGEAGAQSVTAGAASKKAEVMEERVKELHEELKQTQEQVEWLEKDKATKREHIDSIRKENEEIRKRYENGLTKEQSDELEGKISRLEDKVSELEIECLRYQKLADIASDQAVSTEALLKRRNEEQKELDNILKTLRDESSSRDSDSVTIAKLQQELWHTRSGYAAFLRRFKMSQSALQRTQISLNALETAADQATSEAYKKLEDSRVREIALLRQIDRLRNAPEEHDLDSTTSKVSRAKYFQKSIRQLSDLVERAREEADKSKEQTKKAQGDIDAIKRDNKSLIRSLRDVVAVVEGKRPEELGIPMPSDDPQTNRDSFKLLQNLTRKHTDSSSTSQSANTRNKSTRHVATKIVSLHEELRSSQLAQLQYRRDLDRTRHEVKMLQQGRNEDESHIRTLEEEVVSLRSELARTEDRYRRHVIDTSEKEPQKDSEEYNKHEHSNGDSVREFKSLSKNDGVYVSKKEKDAEVSALEDQISEYESKIKSLQDSLNHSRRLGKRRKRVISFLASKIGDDVPRLKQQLKELEHPEQFGGEAEHDLSQEGMDVEDKKEVKQMQAAAKSTIAHFRQDIEKKERTIRTLEEKLQYIQQELVDERQKSGARAAQFSDTEFRESQAAIAHLREAMNKFCQKPDSAQQAHQDVWRRVDELDRSLLTKEREIDGLKKQLQQTDANLKQSEETKAAAEEDARSARDELKKLQNEVSGEKVQKTISSLREQVSNKDSKIKALQSSLLALKSEFERLEKSHASSKNIRSRSDQNQGKDSTRQKSAHDHSEEMESKEQERDCSAEKVKSLEDRLRRAKQQLELLQQNESQLQSSLAKLERQKETAEATAEEHEKSANRAWQEVKSLRRELSTCQKEMSMERARWQQAMSELVAEGLLEESRMEQSSQLDNINKLPEAVRHLKMNIEEFRRRNKILEAQNAALRSASGNGASRTQEEPKPASEHSHREQSREPESDSTRKNWQMEKKLRGKIEKISSDLNEKAKEARELQKTVNTLQKGLDNARKDNSKLEKKVSSLSKRLSEYDEGKQSLLKDIQPIGELRSQLQQAEEQISQLKLKTEGELSNEVDRLNKELKVKQEQSSHWKKKADQAEQRLEKLLRLINARFSHGPGQEPSSEEVEGTIRSLSDDAKLTLEEDLAKAEVELRRELRSSQKRLDELESTLLSRDASILELQFELAEAKQREERLNQHLKEAETICRLVEGDTESRDPLHSYRRKQQTDTKDSAPKKERQLEETISALKRVVEKQRQQLERAKQREESEQKAAERYKRECSKLQQRIQKLEEEGGTGKQEGGQSTKELHQELQNLQKTLKERDEKIRKQQRREEDLKDKLNEATQRIERLSSSRERSSIDANELYELREKINQLEEENNTLRKENEDLREELSAFDAEFFEEIEDLKYQYALSLQKCKMFDEYLHGEGKDPVRVDTVEQSHLMGSYSQAEPAVTAAFQGSGVGDPSTTR